MIPFEIVIAKGVQEFGGIRLDTTDWPFVVLDFPARHERPSLVATLAQLEEILLECQKLREKCYVITDLSRIRHIPGADQRKYSATWMQRTLELNRSAAVGGANIAPTPILRGMLTAVFWLRPPPWPAALVASREDAIVRGVEAFDAAGIVLPERLRTLGSRRAG